MQRRFVPLLTPLLLLTALLAAQFTFNDRSVLRTRFVNTSYYVIFVLFLVWAAVVLDAVVRARPDFRALARKYGVPLAASFGLAALVFVSVPPTFRVLADEANVMSVSKSMTFEKKVDNVIDSQYTYDQYWPKSRVLEKRPFMYPFFTGILHTLTGYRVANAFALNFFVLALVYFMAYFLMLPFGRACAAAAVLLVAAQPLVSYCATSAGFELMQTLFVMICFVLVRWYVQNPVEERFRVLWLTLLVLMNVRYESFIFFFITLAVLTAFRLVRTGYFNQSIVYALTPLCLLPSLWQRTLMIGSFQEPEGVPVFAVSHFIKWNKMFLSDLFYTGDTLPYASAVNLAGVAAIVYFAWRFARRARSESRPRLALVACAVLNVAGAWVVFTAHFLGMPNLPAAARFFVLFCVLLSIGAAALAAEARRAFRIPAAYLVLAAAAMFALYHPVAVQGNFFNAQTITREYDLVLAFIQRLPTRRFLLIYPRPGLFTVHNLGVSHPVRANTQKRTIIEEFERRVYEEIYVVQEIDLATGRPDKGSNLDPAYRLETLYELQNGGNSFLRFSRVANPRRP